MDHYGGKVVMAWGVALWSLATFLTPWAAETSLFALLTMRMLLGIAEGVALPCMNNMIARYANYQIEFVNIMFTSHIPCLAHDVLKIWCGQTAKGISESLILDGFLKQNDQELLDLQWRDFSLEVLLDSHFLPF